MCGGSGMSGPNELGTPPKLGCGQDGRHVPYHSKESDSRF